MDAVVKRVLIGFLIFLNSCTKTLFCIPPGVCRHTPSCSAYARICIETNKPAVAIFKIAKRLLSCNPFFSRTIPHVSVQHPLQ